MRKAELPNVGETEYESEGSFKSYLEYNKILRTWFVAFGIGGPALILANSQIAERLVKAGEMRLIATLFLAGAASQVVGAFVNKVANYYVYQSAEASDKERGVKHCVAEKVVEQFWIDLLLDLITMGCFGIAAWKMLTVFAP